MNNIVKIAATDKAPTATAQLDKKSLLSQHRKWEDRRIKQENREISNRMFSQ